MESLEQYAHALFSGGELDVDPCMQSIQPLMRNPHVRYFSLYLIKLPEEEIQHEQMQKNDLNQTGNNHQYMLHYCTYTNNEEYGLGNSEQRKPHFENIFIHDSQYSLAQSQQLESVDALDEEPPELSMFSFSFTPTAPPSLSDENCSTSSKKPLVFANQWKWNVVVQLKKRNWVKQRQLPRLVWHDLHLFQEYWNQFAQQCKISTWGSEGYHVPLAPSVDCSSFVTQQQPLNTQVVEPVSLVKEHCLGDDSAQLTSVDANTTEVPLTRTPVPPLPTTQRSSRNRYHQILQ